MATPTRRSTRVAAAAAASPAADHSPAASPDVSSEAPRQARVTPASQRKTGSKQAAAASPSSGTPPAYLLLALLMVVGGVLYSQYAMKQPQAGAGVPATPATPAASTATPAAATPAQAAQAQDAAAAQDADEQPKRGLAEEGAAAGGGEPPPPLVEFSAEEKAVFEAACEEHYRQPAASSLLPEETSATEEEGAVGEGDAVTYPYTMEGEAGLEEALFEEEGADVAPREQLDPDRDTGAHAEDYFNAEVHQGYLDLPPWPETTEAEMTGSWRLTEEIYDYAASLPMTKVLSMEAPRVMLFPSFLSPEEVDHMIKVSRDNLERSEVLVAEGEETVNDVRTSFGFWPEQDEVITGISERMHRAIGIPENFGEGLYVLNYQHGQQYEAHNDHCMDGTATDNKADAACLDFLKRSGGPECGPGKGGPTCGDRVATFILYLKSPASGGQTAFPDAEATKLALGEEHRGGNTPDEWYCTDNRTLSASPTPGTGILFWNYRPGTGPGTGSYEDGTAQAEARTVAEALHAGCPVWEGEKYIATRWIRSTGFDHPRIPPVAPAA